MKNTFQIQIAFLFNVDIFQNCTRALFLDRTGYIGSQQMYTLFRDFLDVIVVKQYGYTIVEKGNNEELGDNEIEYFQFGDSRHIAFLNLLLSGFSPYTIAQNWRPYDYPPTNALLRPPGNVPCIKGLYNGY